MNYFPCPTPIELSGGPQDGARVHPVGHRLADPIHVGPKWLGDGFAAWSSEACERFPAQYRFDHASGKFAFECWNSQEQTAAKEAGA